MNIKQALSDFIESSRRVLIVARKPNMQEYNAMIKVTGLGILLIGFIGFIIFLVFAVFRLGGWKVIKWFSLQEQLLDKKA